MANRIKYTSIFERDFKRYSKKYRSLEDDVRELEEQLLENPRLGEDLGSGLFKVRLAVKSKGKGKSGGFRVINYLVVENRQSTEINLLLMYDKSETEDVPKRDLLRIVKMLFD